jgi:hypothetical protein
MPMAAREGPEPVSEQWSTRAAGQQMQMVRRGIRWPRSPSLELNQRLIRTRVEPLSPKKEKQLIKLCQRPRTASWKNKFG